MRKVSNKKVILLIADIIIAALLICMDQVIKSNVSANLTLNEYVEYWPGFIYLKLLHNPGAAFSIFENKKIFLIIIGIIFLSFVSFIVVKLPDKNKFISANIFLSMIIAGGIGNMIDRIRFNYVVDYIGFDFWKSYPIFNFADICVVLGVIGLFILFIFVYKEDDLDFIKIKKHTDKINSDDLEG